MALLNPDFYVDGGNDILKRMSQSFSENSQANETFWNEGTTDTRFKTGDQNLWNEIYGNGINTHKKRFNFNRIRRVVNMVSGYQRRNRKSTVVMPQEGSDELTADQFSTLLQWVNNQTNAYHTISEAFEGALTTGLNLMSVWLDFRSDPVNGDIRIDNLNYNNVLLDQYFTKPDMSDAAFIWTRKFLTRDQAASLIPERKKEIMQMSGSFKDNKFRWLPPNFRSDSTNLVALDEYWYQDFRSQNLLVDMQSGEVLEWKGTDKNLKLFLRDYPQVKVTKTEKRTTRLAIVVNNIVMFDGPNPLGIDPYPFIPVLGYFEPEAPYYEWKIQGIVRGLRDAQYLYNRRKIIELDILESQLNSGFKVMEDSLVDDNDAFLTGQGRALFLKKDAPLGMGSVESLIPPQIPPSMIQLSEMLSQEINQISGVNEELLGSAQDDKAGILSMMRQGAGLTTLQSLFDNLDRSQKILGEITMAIIQENWEHGKVRRVLGEDPSEQFFNKSFQKYDSVVTEGTLTETQRKASFITLLEMQKLGIQIPPEILIDKAPIPEKKDLKAAMEAQAKAASEAQAQAQQLQMQQLQAQINLANARAEADKGLGLERKARIAENQELAIERRAKAIEDISDARLNRARTLKELQDLDISQINALVDLAEKLGLFPNKGGDETIGEEGNVG